MDYLSESRAVKDTQRNPGGGAGENFLKIKNF